jgi:hypothetical protein
VVETPRREQFSNCPAMDMVEVPNDNPAVKPQPHCLADPACIYPPLDGQPYCRLHALDFSLAISLCGSTAREAMRLGEVPFQRTKRKGGARVDF